MSLWDDIRRELAHLYEILTTGEATPDEETREETEEEYTGSGGFFGDDESPEEPSDSGGLFPDVEPPVGYDNSEGDGYFTYQPGEGPYKENWGQPEIRFWDQQFNEHVFDNRHHYDVTLDKFERAFMDQSLTYDERKEARNDFKSWTYIADINWRYFREYYASI